jgi:hypothetical protein
MSFVTGPRTNTLRNKAKPQRPNLSSPTISHQTQIYLEDIPNDLVYKDLPAFPSRTLPSPPSNLRANPAHPNSLGPLVSHQSPEPSSREAPLSPSSRPAPRNIRQELAPTPDLLSPRSSNDFEDVDFEYQGSVEDRDKGKGKRKTTSGVAESYMGELGQFNNPAFETSIGKSLDAGNSEIYGTDDGEADTSPKFDLRRLRVTFSVIFCLGRGKTRLKRSPKHNSLGDTLSGRVTNRTSKEAIWRTILDHYRCAIKY